MIEIKNLTMKYTSGKGVFDIDFCVQKGKVVGFLGHNGSGKTTTIRCLLGFMRATGGSCSIDGRDCFNASPQNCLNIGFIAGEPAFPETMTGLEYLNFIIDVRSKKAQGNEPKAKNEMKAKMNELLAYFELDARTRINRMSKGMKQKTAIIAAFVHDPEILILDEPTSGLDPIMQTKFVDLILSEKRKGKTILMSSHMFEEVERTADEIVIIKEGRIVAKDNVKNLKAAQRKIYFVSSPDVKKMKFNIEHKKLSDTEIELYVELDKIDAMIKELAKYKITDMYMKEASLENIFMQFYKENAK